MPVYRLWGSAPPKAFIKVWLGGISRVFIQQSITTARVCKLILMAISAVAVQGGVISFTGDLRTDATFTSCGNLCTLNAGNTDADYAQWAAFAANFNVPVTSTMTAISFSYGGGVNGNATAIARNGFEPYLSLFDASGNFLASTFFGITCPAGANTNVDTLQCYDVELDGGVLAAGSYSIAISAFENMSMAENPGGTLADGFTGIGNLAAGEDLHYAFDVILTSTTTSGVPEPGSVVLVTLAGVAGYFSTQKRKGQKS